MKKDEEEERKKRGATIYNSIFQTCEYEMGGMGHAKVKYV